MSDQKREDILRLNTYIKAINEATKASDVRKVVTELESALHEMRARSSGDQKQTIINALQEIEKFWRYDSTRKRVCMRARTLIVHINLS